MSLSCCVADQQREVLAAIAAEEAVEAQAFARRMRLRAVADGLWGQGPEAFAVLELAGTARIGQVRAQTQLTEGRRLVQLFPQALALLETGELYRECAALLLSLTASCTEPVQAAVGRRVTAPIAGLNTSDARKIITRAVLETEADLDPDLTRERLERAKRGRAVWTSPQPDDLLRISADLTAIAGRRWALDFEELVRAQKVADADAGIVRTQAQRRADVFAELPNRVITLIHLIQQGHIQELLAAAHTNPDTQGDAGDAGDVGDMTDMADMAGVLADLEDLAAQTLDLFPHPTNATVPTPTEPTHRTGSPHPEPAGVEPAVTEPIGVEPARECARRGRPSHQDLLIGLLRQRLRNPVTVTVHIPMTTLLELDHRSGWLEGYGPVTAEHTRLLVPMAGLRQLYVAHDSGLPLALDPITHPPLYNETPDGEAAQQVAQQVRDRLLAMLSPTGIAQAAEARHDPSTALRAFVETRDQTCLGIGCNHPAQRSDKDHETRWPQGPTAAWNLSSKSPRCHHAKHHGWTTHREDTGPDAGTTTWTSPLGHSYNKPGVWTAPTRLPLQVTLPPASYQAYDNNDPNTFQHPLLPEPTPTPTVKITTTWNNDQPPFYEGRAGWGSSLTTTVPEDPPVVVFGAALHRCRQP